MDAHPNSPLTQTDKHTPDFTRVERLGLQWTKFGRLVSVQPDSPAILWQIKLLFHLT